jgi:spore maturation protein CgeB
MRLLIVGYGARGSLERSYGRAFARCEGVEVDFFRLDEDRFAAASQTVAGRVTRRLFQPLRNGILNRRLVRHIKAALPYDAAIVFKGAELTPAGLAAARLIQPRTVWINYNPDDPLTEDLARSTNSNIVQALPYYDIHATWSQRVKHALESRGLGPVLYVPFGYDADALVGLGTPGSAKCAVFVGAWDEERERVLSALGDLSIRIYGNSWGRAGGRGLKGKIIARGVYEEDLMCLHSQAAVSINLLRPQNKHGHNMRTFEVPAAGGVLVTDRTAEQARWFPEGRACLMYSGAEELRRQVVAALEQPTRYDAMRVQARRLARVHSYDSRAAMMLEYLNDFSKERNGRNGGASPRWREGTRQ